MTVVLNEAAITALLTAPAGPIMREVERRGEIARGALQHRINGIMHDSPFLFNLAQMRMTPEGAIIGIRDEAGANPGKESIAEYLDFKLGVQEPWWDEVGEEAASGS